MSAIQDVFAPAPQPKTELGRYRVLSTTAGVRVSPLCLGGMSIGSAWSSFLGSMDKDQSYQLLDAFADAGGNFIDTANNYQNEESEQILGEWMAARRNRDIMFVATKFTTQYRKHELGPGKWVNYSGNHKKSLHLSVRDSLGKLQTDYIDLLYVHWWDWTTSIEELMDSLHILVEQGKVLYLGVSDTPAWVVSAANTYAKAHGKTPFSVYQGRWNVLIRDLERDIIPMARHFGMALSRGPPEGLRCTFGPNQSDEERKASEVLEQIAKEHGTESVQQIALAYVMQKARYVFPVVGGRKAEHLEDNIKALSIRLTDEQIQTIESFKKFYIGFPMDFILDDPREGGQTPPLMAASAPMNWQLQGKPIGQE
ncbi:aldo/keto reductase [Colletotrichum caudatum]|nr:aldo/keto reductase [Colletotrichum caudatum]